MCKRNLSQKFEKNHFFLLLKKEIHVIKIYDKKKEFKIEN